MPGMAVRIADDGEIEFKGPLVFDGYWNDDAATAEVMLDGWFSTGDLGSSTTMAICGSPVGRRNCW